MIVLVPRQPKTTAVFDTFWRYAAARQALYYERLQGPVAPTDPILKAHRFTNVFRASDRVSQYLIRHVIYGAEARRPEDSESAIVRILLFKIFNRIETWSALQSATTISSDPQSLDAVEHRLLQLHASGSVLYSAAYMMPPPPGTDGTAKCVRHVQLLRSMLRNGSIERLRDARSLGELFDVLLAVPSFGRFLAFQYAIDINYASALTLAVGPFDENDFVVAGPGAIDGISKCFSDCAGLSPEDIIRWTNDRQVDECARLGLTPPTLFGRPLHLIDTQNVYCEISKYARVAHPEVAGSAGRTRIKQRYHANPEPMPPPFFPPHWALNVSKLPLPALPELPELELPTLLGL